MSELITRAVNTYADNHVAALERLTEALRTGDDAAVQLALTVLRAQIQTDFQRYSIAVVNAVQTIVSRNDEHIDDLKIMIGALAEQQATFPSELRAALGGISHQIAEEVRAALTTEVSS